MNQFQIVVTIDLSEATKAFLSKMLGTSAPAQAAPAQAAPAISIEDLRALMSEKVANHRQEIKAKLSELGAPSVTKLDQSCYAELYNFLNEL